MVEIVDNLDEIIDDEVLTYLSVNTSKDIAKTLLDLGLLKHKGIATLEKEMVDSDVNYLFDLYKKWGFENVEELWVNPTNLSAESRYKLQDLVCNNYDFPEVHYTNSEWEEISNATIEHITTNNNSNQYDNLGSKIKYSI